MRLPNLRANLFEILIAPPTPPFKGRGELRLPLSRVFDNYITIFAIKGDMGDTTFAII
jgi:hypothetical protein